MSYKGRLRRRPAVMRWAGAGRSRRRAALLASVVDPHSEAFWTYSACGSTQRSDPRGRESDAARQGGDSRPCGSDMPRSCAPAFGQSNDPMVRSVGPASHQQSPMLNRLSRELHAMPSHDRQSGLHAAPESTAGDLGPPPAPLCFPAAPGPSGRPPPASRAPPGAPQAPPQKPHPQCGYGHY